MSSMPRKRNAQLHPAYGKLLLAVTIEPEEVGRRIKVAREKKLWTQMDFAREASVSVSSIQRWESGRLPPVRELIRLAKLLDADAADFVELNHDPEPLTRSDFQDAMNDWLARLRGGAADQDVRRLEHAEVLRKLDETQELLRTLMASVQGIDRRLG